MNQSLVSKIIKIKSHLHNIDIYHNYLNPGYEK